jgi:hypothetical protein
MNVQMVRRNERPYGRCPTNETQKEFRMNYFFEQLASISAALKFEENETNHNSLHQFDQIINSIFLKAYLFVTDLFWL